MRSWRVVSRYRGARTTTTFPNEAAARAYVKALRARGVRTVYTVPV